ncbi:MAG TPA: diacylglycerol kinase family protein [Thermoleophilaceae bacterium]|nr:diacylglycerol kinase family protein [Thermoleophilaceae bacterium]
MAAAQKPRVLMMVNAAAGGSTDAIAAEVEERCAGAGAVEAVRTTSGDEAVEVASRAAADATADVVVAVGGDGTVRGVAEGLARGLGRWPGGAGDGSAGADGAAPALFVVPAGSGNSVYRALCGELPWADALDAALAGRAPVRELDLIRIVDADRGALLGVNAGLIARIAEIIEELKAEARAAAGEGVAVTSEEADADAVQQRYWGAIGQALEELDQFPVRVTIDDRQVHDGTLTMATVGGVRRFGRGSFEVLPRSVLDDGLLDVCVIAGVTREELQELAAAVPAGQHLGRPGVSYEQGRRIAIERTDGQPLGIEHDGDPYPAGTAIELEVVRAAVPALAAPDGGAWG